jgi:CBS domain-containing protein
MDDELSEHAMLHSAGVLPTRRPSESSQQVRLSDPALRSMTDFTSKFAITIAPERRIDAALAEMIKLGVRSMLVVREGGVIGLITSYDIEGPRALKFTASGEVRREDIRVRDIMSQWQDLPTLDWHTVQTAKISDLVEIFAGVGVMHLLVVETDQRGAEVVRGLISRSRMERELQASEFLPRQSLTTGAMRAPHQ